MVLVTIVALVMGVGKTDGFGFLHWSTLGGVAQTEARQSRSSSADNKSPKPSPVSVRGSSAAKAFCLQFRRQILRDSTEHLGTSSFG